MTGGASFNEVFFNDVRIPDDHRLGDVNQGWTVALTTLMIRPMLATTSTPPPSTSSGESRRCTAVNTIQADAATNANPFTSAPRTSARSSPNVCRSVEGRVVSRNATSATTSAPTSVSMWTASASSAREWNAAPAAISATM